MAAKKDSKKTASEAELKPGAPASDMKKSGSEKPTKKDNDAGDAVAGVGGNGRLKFRITNIDPTDPKVGPDLRVEYLRVTRDAQGVEQHLWVGKDLSTFNLSPTQKSALWDILRAAQSELLSD